MSRDYNIYLQDILSAIEKIQHYAEKLDYASFKSNPMIVDAVVRNLEIIGEAAKNVPNGVKIKHKTIEWQKISGLRDILIHQYFGVDVEILWDIIENKLATLKKDILDILN